jgi:arylsulfatase
MGRLTENSIVNIKNKSYSVTADVDVPRSGAEGVIIAQGGNTNGWSLYAKGGKLKYCYNFFGIDLTFVESAQPLLAGHHQVRMEFKYDGGGLGKGGAISLYVDGKPVGQGRIERSVPMAYSADETCDIGMEGGSPVSPDYGPTGNEFSGEVNWVQIDLEKDDQDHLIAPEERFRVAMARQ